MSATYLHTAQRPWRLALSAASTATSFAAKNPTKTEPTGSGVIDLATQDSLVQFAFFGTDAANETFDARVIGWSKLYNTDLWIPSPIVTVSVTLGAQTGVDGESIDDTDLLADTIVHSSGNTEIVLNSPANDTLATLTVDATGFDKLEVTFDMTGAASGNAIYRSL